MKLALLLEGMCSRLANHHLAVPFLRPFLPGIAPPQHPCRHKDHERPLPSCSSERREHNEGDPNKSNRNKEKYPTKSPPISSAGAPVVNAGGSGNGTASSAPIEEVTDAQSTSNKSGGGDREDGREGSHKAAEGEGEINGSAVRSSRTKTTTNSKGAKLAGKVAASADGGEAGGDGEHVKGLGPAATKQSVAPAADDMVMGSLSAVKVPATEVDCSKVVGGKGTFGRAGKARKCAAVAVKREYEERQEEENKGVQGKRFFDSMDV